MKKCEYASVEIIKYVTCKMTKEDETKFQYHLFQCDKCRRQVENYRRLRDDFISIINTAD